MPRGYDGLPRRVAELERLLNRSMTARKLESAVIGKGGLSVKGGQIRILDAATGDVLFVADSDGITLSGDFNVNDLGSIYVNNGGSVFLRTPDDVAVVQASRIDIPDGSGRTQQVFVLRRDDGSQALVLADLGTVLGHDHQQALVANDHDGNVIFAEDAVSGQGLARPLVPLGDWVSNSYPTDTTNSGSFQTLQTLTGFKQMPKITMQMLVRIDDGSTTGEIRVIDQDSNVIGSVQSISAGAYVYLTIGPVDMPGTHCQSVGLSIQGRVTAGTGSIGARGTAAWGTGS